MVRDGEQCPDFALQESYIEGDKLSVTRLLKTISLYVAHQLYTSPAPGLSTCTVLRKDRTLRGYIPSLSVEILPLQTFSSATRTEKMPTARIDGQLDKPQLDVLVDLGHPLLNRVFDGFVKVGGVGAAHAVSQDSVKFLLQDETNKQSLEKIANRVGKESIQWGLVAGVYSGLTYTLEEARGVHDWKNALLGGALTGAALSLTEANASGDRAFKGALTGGAIATAAEILKNIT